MSVNLLTTIQKNLGYAPLHKVDPNKEDVTEKEIIEYEDLFGQAAIPTVLIGLHRYVAHDTNAAEVLHYIGKPVSWVNKIFGNLKDEVILNIVSYSGLSHSETYDKMNIIAEEAIRLIHEQIPPERKIADIKHLLSSQRHDILTYLPAPLHIGELLKDNTLDDNTNKMEGPISNLMHLISKTFSKPVTEKELIDKEHNY